MGRIVARFFIATFLTIFMVSPVFAAPIMVDNGTAEILPKGKWDAEFHYQYYPFT